MHRACLAVSIAVVLLFGLLVTFAAGATPKQQSSWGIIITDAGGQGVVIAGVNTRSSASMADLKTGDVLLAINGTPVRSAQEFRAIKNDFPLYTPLKLSVRRGGRVIEPEIMLAGIVALDVKPVESDFVIPGVPPSPRPGEVSAVDALDEINVLDQVILDPRTGQIAVMGHYDARFNTGPIPYLDLLKTAMLYPKPKFNLEHSPEVKRSEETSDARRWRANEFILGHPALEQERQLLIRLWASGSGLSPQELVRLYNYVNFDSRQPVPPGDLRAIQATYLRSLGYSEAAKAYDMVNQEGPDGPLKALQSLGRSDEARVILAEAGNDPTKAKGKMTAAAYLAIMESVHAPGATIGNLRADLDQGRSTWEQVATKAQGRLMPTVSNKDGRDVVMLAINKILISSKGTSALMKSPLTGEVVLEPVKLDRTSQLARIMYEADYSLKSLVVMPQLFWQIPGSMSQLEYNIYKGLDKSLASTKETGLKSDSSTEFWLEPKLVAMTVSPDRRVVSFGVSQMDHKSLTHGQYAKDYRGDTSGFYDEWCAFLVSHYDECARVLPAFHKVREAAKVIALANWLLDTKTHVDLSGVDQEKWDAPKRVPGFWKSGFLYAKTEDGAYTSFISSQAAFSGGVVFTKSNWTQVTPAPQGETGVLNSLTMSAGLGQKAVQAARSGDLESARYLSELSAQAMTGKLSQSDLAKMKISLPQAKPMAVSPDNVRLQKEMIKKTHQEITVMGKNPASASNAAATLGQLDSLYDQMRDKPAAASDYLVQLQTGKLPPPPSRPVTTQTAAARPPAETVCGESSLGDTRLTPARLEYLTGRMKEARDRLKYINEAMRKLIALNEAQRAEIDKLTAQITEQYEKAQDRAWDVVIDLLSSVSLDAFQAQQAKRLKAIEEAISGKTAMKTATLGTGAVQKAQEEILDNDIKLLQSAKFRMEEAYAPTENLIAVFKGANYGKDIDEWQRENKDSWKRAKTSLALLGNLALDHPKLEEWLGKRAFFYGESLWQVAAMGRMAYYGWGFFEDIAAQIAFWGPMTNRLQNGLKQNVEGMEHLRQRAAETSQEVDCLEKLLHK